MLAKFGCFSFQRNAPKLTKVKGKNDTSNVPPSELILKKKIAELERTLEHVLSENAKLKTQKTIESDDKEHTQ